MKKVAIQGVRGAFHEIAARQYFESMEIEIVPCITFCDLFTAMQSGTADCAIMAIENTVAGGLLSNYTLLQESDYRINGETYLRIQQNLLVLNGQTIDDLEEVHSHHMAIAQTRQFFSNYPHIKLIESDDTALSAQQIADNKETKRGAIASELAAEQYGLHVLARSIETHKKNFTRFLVIEKDCKILENTDKASLCFSLPHEKGSLAKVLSIFSYYDINLTKIQSLPKLGEEWHYLFYVDIVYDKYQKYSQAVSAIKPLTINFQVLGEYKKAITI